MRNEQSRLTNLFQSISFRLLPSFTNTFRIYYSTQVDLQQFVTGRTFFLLQSAFAQLNGYYLYHLRKLLI